jgi:nickel-dependent lactate racemase
MTAAEATVNGGGVIIMLASSDDGTGGDHFYHQLADEPDINKTMEQFLNRGRNETLPDQWQSQILLRILMRARVIYLSNMPDDMVEAMHMTPAHSIDEAMQKAKKILGNSEATVTAIPDGVAVVVI